MKKYRIVFVVGSFLLTTHSLLIFPSCSYSEELIETNESLESETEILEEDELIINEVTFPDPVFRAYLKANLTQGSDVLTTEIIQSTLQLDLKGTGIKNVQGIEYFTALESLDCSDLGLTIIDISAHSKLVNLTLDSNELTNLDVQNNLALAQLSLKKNKLSKLDITKNTNLEQLFLQSNKLQTLNVSENLNLEEINAQANEISQLDVTKNVKLTELIIAENNIQKIDVSNNLLLTRLDIFLNQLSELDISKNTNLGRLNARDNQLTTLDVSHLNLESLSVGNNRLKKLDVTNSTNLEVLYFGVNELTNIDLHNNPKLTSLDVQHNQLSELDLSKNPNIEKLNARNNKLSVVEVGHLNLESLDVRNNQLKNIDIRNSSKLTKIDCGNNQIEVVDLRNNPLIEAFDFQSNQLKELDFSNNPKLVTVYARNNQLASLDVSHLNLTTLVIGGNQLKSINVESSTKLSMFLCGNNLLTEISLGHNPELKELELQNNQLKQLDVTKNPKLNNLKAYNNQLVSLNLTKNPVIDFAKSSFSSQKSATDIYFKKGKWHVDFAKLTGVVFDGVQVATPKWEYDSESGIASITGTYKNPPKQVKYIYQPVIDPFSQKMDVSLSLTALVARGEDVTVNYKDTAGRQIHDPIVLSGNLTDKWQVEKLAIPEHSFKEINGKEAGEFTESRQEVTIIYDRRTLEIVSFPTIVDFGNHLFLKDAKVNMPEYSEELIVADNRVAQTAWTLSVALEQELTSENDPMLTLPGAIYYKMGDGTKEILGNHTTEIYSNDGKEAGDFNISNRWSEAGEGIKLEIAGTEAIYPEKYQAIFVWKLIEGPPPTHKTE